MTRPTPKALEGHTSKLYSVGSEGQTSVMISCIGFVKSEVV